MKARLWGALALAGVMSACATQKEMVPTGGSRADGTVQLSFEYGMFEKPVVDMSRASTTAGQRCAAWGYNGAEPFGGQMNRCEQMGQYGCMLTLVSVTFQCTGTPPASR